jgi:hypothetical protein
MLPTAKEGLSGMWRASGGGGCWLVTENPGPVTVEPEAISVIGPVRAPAGTVARTWLASMTVKDEVEMPPNETLVVVDRFSPWMMTVELGAPANGE